LKHALKHKHTYQLHAGIHFGFFFFGLVLLSLTNVSEILIVSLCSDSFKMYSVK
ncbi:hypothetical protein X975_26917, partial [Stegodyphus mimosarum]